MPTLCVVRPPADRAQLAPLVANGQTPQKRAVRASLLLRLADHVRPSQMATRLALSRNHVHDWRRRYVAQGVGGVRHDAPRPGRHQRITAARVATMVEATLTTRPPAATPWRTRTMATAPGISEGMVRRIWHQHGRPPHRVTRFKWAQDPRFVDKLRDVVGLYLNPPDQAVVFCGDEKRGIQALDRTRPVLPLLRNVPERHTHDDLRHGTTCLYAARRLLDGAGLGTCRPQRDTTEFVRCLDPIEAAPPADHTAHVILDPVSTHQRPPV